MNSCEVRDAKTKWTAAALMADCVFTEAASIKGEGMTGREADDSWRISGKTAFVVSGEGWDLRGGGDLAFQQEARWNK